MTKTSEAIPYARRVALEARLARGAYCRAAVAALVTLTAWPTLARADHYEAQWSARPMVGFAQVHEDGTSGSSRTPMAGLSLGLSYGLSHQLDLGIELVVASTAMARFRDASLTLDGGAETHSPLERRSGTALALIGPTWRFGVTWVPVVSLAAGAGVRMRSAGRFSEFDLYPMDRNATTSLDLGASARVGIERRVNRRLTVGAYVSALAALSSSAPVLPMGSVSVGLSYVNYPLW